MNIYFICTGNTCRSPMAAAILEAKNYAEVHVRSAGIYAYEGGDMSVHAKEILTRNGISDEHSSSPFTAEDAQWADLILTMTAGHKELVIRHVEEAAHKTFTLKEYVASQSGMDIHDPFGGSLEQYEATFRELTEAITELEKKLKAEGKLEDE